MHKARSLLNALSLCASYHQPVCVFAGEFNGCAAAFLILDPSEYARAPADTCHSGDGGISWVGEEGEN